MAQCNECTELNLVGFYYPQNAHIKHTRIYNMFTLFNLAQMHTIMYMFVGDENTHGSKWCSLHFASFKAIGFRKEMLTFQKHILNKSKLIELVVDFSFELQWNIMDIYVCLKEYIKFDFKFYFILMFENIYIFLSIY